jgi:hypothetical protein
MRSYEFNIYIKKPFSVFQRSDQKTVCCLAINQSISLKVGDLRHCYIQLEAHQTIIVCSSDPLFSSRVSIAVYVDGSLFVPVFQKELVLAGF